jgi:threonine aldolase
MKIIDLRSDTVTRPTAEMKAAMMHADLGDDVFDDDPTVHALQQRVAQMLGHEAALFMPTGTQANLVALMTHCARGDEFLVGQKAHCYLWEGGGAAVLGSIQPQPLPHQSDGTLALADMEAAIKPDDLHFARTRLLCLENTLAGKVLPLSYLQDATQLARQHGLATHLDGARLFNVVAKTDIAAAQWAAEFDSVSVCFSKGLGAPVGSALVGPKPWIQAAKRWRKMAGGGMRQSGMLAAAALYALDHHIERLTQDHQLAQRLAQGLAELSWLEVEPPQTNMVFARTTPLISSGFINHLKTHGVLITGLTGSLRFVMHLDINEAAVERTLQVARAYLPD